jgi:hypothetical protein
MNGRDETTISVLAERSLVLPTRLALLLRFFKPDIVATAMWVHASPNLACTYPEESCQWLISQSAGFVALTGVCLFTNIDVFIFRDFQPGRVSA